MNAPYAIHWFRRDLRVRGNAALTHAVQRLQGRVVGVFFFDSVFLARADFSHRRFGFFLQTLRALREELQACGGELLVLNAPPPEGWEQLLGALSQPPACVSWNRDYEPFARERDAGIEALLRERGIAVATARDHLWFEPVEVVKPTDGTPYQVFTPYARRWLELAASVRERAVHLDKTTPLQFTLRWKELGTTGLLAPGRDALAHFVERNAPNVDVPLPPAGAAAARAALARFEPKLAEYSQERDVPSRAGTSQLSIYFKNGSLTVPEVVGTLGGTLGGDSGLTQLFTAATTKSPRGEARYLIELVWREFYYSILFHHPRVEKEAFLEHYRALKWQNREDWFSAWCEGRTGFPIVDAGMRQLRATGWMHNRVRMIVASFLTKDLLIDWRWGERWFMQQLLDGDLAPNNGGWQWAASTGVDPQPYFRIFNPTSQGERFDPDGTYVRSWVPELAAVSAKEIHDPKPATRMACGYPPPIVDHALQRTRALALFKKGPSLQRDAAD